jgi:hypothetical protein
MRRSVVRSCWFGSGCPVLRTDTRENPVGKNGVMTTRKQIIRFKSSIHSIVFHILLPTMITQTVSIQQNYKTYYLSYRNILSQIKKQMKRMADWLTPVSLKPIIRAVGVPLLGPKSNARDTTNFTTKCLQTDMASYMDITQQKLMTY